MARIFTFSFLAGLVLAGLAAAFWPLPGHVRFRSLIAVQSDGGAQENFRIEWPGDRIARPGENRATLPAGAAVGVSVLEDSAGRRSSAELFRLRDVEDNVIGVAARLAASGGVVADPGRSASTWLLVIPSRGALYLAQTDRTDATARREDTPSGPVMLVVGQSPALYADGPSFTMTATESVPTGRVLGGTSEFAGLTGTFTETWQLGGTQGEGGASGRILLSTTTARAP